MHQLQIDLLAVNLHSFVSKQKRIIAFASVFFHRTVKTSKHERMIQNEDTFARSLTTDSL